MTTFSNNDELLLTEETICKAVQYWLNKKVLSMNEYIDVVRVSKQGNDGKFISDFRVQLRERKGN